MARLIDEKSDTTILDSLKNRVGFGNRPDKPGETERAVGITSSEGVVIVNWCVCVERIATLCDYY
jgi:hypothetical protein